MIGMSFLFIVFLILLIMRFEEGYSIPWLAILAPFWMPFLIVVLIAKGWL